MTIHPHLPCNTKTRLIESALLSFATHGYEGTGIREIAARVDVNMALVAYHFGGKAGLYRETLGYIFRRKGSRLMELLSVLPVGADATHQELIEGLKNYIQVLMESLMSSDHSNPVEMAAMTLMAREMEAPTPGFEQLLLGYLRPFGTYLEGCMKGLRPDLGDEARLAMSLSIHGPMLYLRNALGMIRLLRGNPVFPEELPILIQHFVDFSIRGLGLPETSLPNTCGGTDPCRHPSPNLEKNHMEVFAC